MKTEGFNQSICLMCLDPIPDVIEEKRDSQEHIQVNHEHVSENFKPFRRNLQFFFFTPVSILPLINELSFIQNKKSWGYPFRFGFFEIHKNDFFLIAKGMMDISMI